MKERLVINNRTKFRSFLFSLTLTVLLFVQVLTSITFFITAISYETVMIELKVKALFGALPVRSRKPW